MFRFLRFVKKKIKLIINDDFEIAEEFFFDGIHLGQSDKKLFSCKKNLEKIYCW